MASRVTRTPLCFHTRSSSDGQPEHLQLLSMEELIPGLRPLVLWMANSIELLHFIQHDVPQLLPWRQDQEDKGGVEQLAVTQLSLCVCVCVFLNCVCVCFRSAGLGDVLHSDSLRGSHDSPGGSHHVHLPAVRLLSNKGWPPHVDSHIRTVTSAQFTSS